MKKGQEAAEKTRELQKGDLFIVMEGSYASKYRGCVLKVLKTVGPVSAAQVEWGKSESPIAIERGPISMNLEGSRVLIVDEDYLNALRGLDCKPEPSKEEKGQRSIALMLTKTMSKDGDTSIEVWSHEDEGMEVFEVRIRNQTPDPTIRREKTLAHVVMRRKGELPKIILGSGSKIGWVSIQTIDY
jgi:hypothetical protein